jgi:hypothetical protein
VNPTENSVVQLCRALAMMYCIKKNISLLFILSIIDYAYNLSTTFLKPAVLP